MDVPPSAVSLDPDDALTTGRKSGRSPPVEVLVRADRRRRWSAERKREIVAESLEAGCKPGDVALRHGISTGQLYTWRREMLGLQRAVTRSGSPHFASVELTPEPPRLAEAASGPKMPTAPVRPAGLIEIVLPSGVSLRVDAEVDSRALRRVLGALEAR
jgi:transposase